MQSTLVSDLHECHKADEVQAKRPKLDYAQSTSLAVAQSTGDQDNINKTK